ncbi:MAG: MBL fold metallo-hydrolase [Armatimonadota bacterium]|nr:MBL fold metallo-hydrolase [Armatimonadota bacterium]
MALELRCLTVGPLETNCYLLWDRETYSAAVIDPGGDADRIIDEISNHGLRVERVLITHGHIDHCYSAADVAEQCGASVMMHSADVEMLQVSLEIAGQFYDMSDYRSVSPSEFVSEGDVILIGQHEVKVIHTPGHSPGSVSYVAAVGIFCGDAVFASSIGRTDFPGGSHELLIRSIKSKILSFPDDTVLYPGHGPSTTVGRERRSNPYLH